MVNLPWKDASELKDIESLNFIREASASPDWNHAKIWEGILAKGRDNARAPFCWNQEANAGFTTGRPWLRIHPDYCRINAVRSMERPDSLWHFYRDLIRFRRAEPLIATGKIEFVATSDPELLLYRRWDDGGRELWVGAHFSGKELMLLVEGPWRGCSTTEGGVKPVFSNYAVIEDQRFWRPWELRVWRSDPQRAGGMAYN
jgi:glycosidase